MSLAVVTGLAAEARIAVAPRGAMLVGAGRTERLAAELEAAIARGARRLLSFGVAGALAPCLRAGDLVIAHAVLDGGRRLECDADWRNAMSGRLLGAASHSPADERDGGGGHADMEPPTASGLLRFSEGGAWRPLARGGPRRLLADIAGVGAPVADAAAKAALFAATGAAAVDMESAVVARAAQRHGLPFAILRVIADPAHRPLPGAALVAMGADGEVDLLAVLRALIREPRQLPALIRLARDSRGAFAALGRARSALGEDFGSLDLAGLAAVRTAATDRGAARGD
jgi:adenosylhomocysteine nucleosidase